MSVFGCLQKASQRFASQKFAALAVRTNTTIAGTVYYRCAYHDKHATALVAPAEDLKLTYDELWQKVSALAGGLTSLGYHQGDVIATDLQHSAANVIFQMAVAHNGMQVLTVKDSAELDKLAGELYVSGVVMSSGSSSLGNAPFKKNVVSEIKGKGAEGVTDRNMNLAFYNSTTPVSNREVYLVGVGQAGLLEIKPDDVVCVTTSLNSALGLGSVICAMVRNATAYLPDMSKPDIANSTLAIADKGQLDMIRAMKGSKIRGGIVNTGHGDDLLLAKEDVNGVEFKILGSESDGDVMRPLFDACKDTYYSYK